MCPPTQNMKRERESNVYLQFRWVPQFSCVGYIHVLIMFGDGLLKLDKDIQVRPIDGTGGFIKREIQDNGT